MGSLVTEFEGPDGSHLTVERSVRHEREKPEFFLSYDGEGVYLYSEDALALGEAVLRAAGVADLDMRKRDNLLTHIRGLQATLTERNAEIERLRAIINGEEDEERARRMREKAYKEGWKACAATLMQATQDAANNLRTVNRAAYAVYMKGEA